VPSTREEFFQDVRRASRLALRPRVTVDSEVLSEESISLAIHGAALWLTPKVVEKYAPEDFEEWPEEHQERLRSAVRAFRDAAGKVSPDRAPGEDEFSRYRAAFHELTAAVRGVVLADWIQAVEAMIRDVEVWVADQGWHSRRVERKVTESLLGSYALPQLQFFAITDLYVLDPVARFVPGATGAYDMSIQPSHYLTTLYRDLDGGWQTSLDAGRGVARGRHESWNKETFLASLDELRSLV